MEKHNHSLNVECPQCHHVFDVEASLSKQIEKSLKADLAKGQQKALDELQKQREAVDLQQQEIARERATIQQRVDQRVKEERAQIKTSAQKEAQQAQAEEMQALQKKAEEQSQKLSQMKKEQLALLEMKEKLEQAKEDIELETKKAMEKERKRIEADVKQREAEAHRMTDREHQELVKSLTDQIGDLKRRVEQGSMQVQGEAQELELRDLLEDLFRQDVIEEVAKGANGADVLHLVQDRLGRSCGTIAYESKRTKGFSDKWIDKLKGDMQRHQAEIGVVVTETMPKGMTCMGLRDGVFICSFGEVRGLAQVLRQSIVNLSTVRVQEDNRDDKAKVLYAYFTSSDFKRRMQVIVDGYGAMKQQLDKEKQQMQKHWAARDKQLEALVGSATELQGSILGISGNIMEALTETTEAEPN
ncbi:MAG: DUF2130 domain-containing protein [Flavobacteriales bacterium]